MKHRERPAPLGFPSPASALVRALPLAALVALLSGCSEQPDLHITPPEVGWDTSQEETVEESDTGVEEDTWTEEDTETEEEEDAGSDEDTGTEEDTETETETEVDTGPDTDTGPPPAQQGLSCREGLMCLLQGTSALQCLADTDAQAKGLMADVVVCLTSKGCLSDLQNIFSVFTCAFGECGAQVNACLGDN